MQERDARGKLIHRYFDDSLAEAEEAELMASLENNAAARCEFVDQAFLDSDLREGMREADIRSFITSEENESSLDWAMNVRPHTSRKTYPIALRGGLVA